MPVDTGFLRFMILDDEAIIALDLAGMLQDLGHSVCPPSAPLEQFGVIA